MDRWAGDVPSHYRLLVYPDRMRENMDKTNGLIFSQTLMLALIRKEISREEAYRIVQKVAMECWKTGDNFVSMCQRDPGIQSRLTDTEIQVAFDLKHHLRNVDRIFQRIGLTSQPEPSHRKQ